LLKLRRTEAAKNLSGEVWHGMIPFP
jgi:hypothetical protein